MNAQTVAVYYERLCRFPVDRIMNAIDTAIDHNEYFPKVARLIQILEAQPVTDTKLLDSPDQSPEVKARLQALLQNLAETLGAVDEQKREAKILARRALLKEQAKKLGVA